METKIRIGVAMTILWFLAWLCSGADAVPFRDGPGLVWGVSLVVCIVIDLLSAIRARNSRNGTAVDD